MLTVMTVVRKERKITQFDLSRMTNMYQANLSLIERGYMLLKPDEAEVVSKILGIPADELQMEYAEYVRKEALKCHV